MNYDSKIEAETIHAGHGSPDDADNPLAPDPVQERASRRRIIIVGIIAVVLIAGIWLALHGKGDKAAGQQAEQIPVVTVVRPGQSTVAGEISATGTLAARREMPVGSVGEGGEVRSVLVDNGDWVKKGQVLAVVDRSVQSQQIASQAAQVQVAQADARLAQANLDRALQLVDRGFISKANVDQLRATRDAAAARVEVARATLGQLRAQTARLNITAPADGLILERNVEPGQVVGGGGTVLFRVAMGGQLELLAQLSEDELASISTGVPAQVTPVGSGRTFDGQVWQISPIIDPQNRQGIARIALPYDPALRPGGFASAVIRSGTVVAPRLPESAIQSDDKGAFVYVVDGKGIAHRRGVKTGLVTADGITIASGLTGKEMVVLRAGGFINDGDKVKAKLVRETN